MAAPIDRKKANGRSRSLIELKGVDGAYPLSGEMALSPAVWF